MNLRPSPLRIAGAALALGILTLSTGTAAATAATPTPTPTSSSAAETADGPHVYTGSTIDVSGDIVGDVYVAGQAVTISGSVTGDVIAAAQTIVVTGTVDGDVRLAAQDVTVSGSISQSGTVFAADLSLTDTGSFGDDLVGAASDITLEGTVGRDVLIGVDRLDVTGSIGGDLTYSSDDVAIFDDGLVAGTTEWIEPPESTEVEVSPWAVFGGWVLGLLFALLGLGLITLLAGLLLPRWLDRVTGHLVPSPWKALLVGFVASITVPFAVLFLVITVVGAPLALAVMLVWTVLTLASFVYVAYYLGRLLLRGNRHPVITALVGGAILITALQIPGLNILVWFGMVWFGLGAQLLELHRQRPWSTPPTTPSDHPTV
ncbi:hypothetical protein ACEXQD_04275 [Herbiconiux sp. P15]|uniref:hypothetical protein n=1 Tax=Herbiconiux liukaitaii TaxID=3342799 RepID=UPI0035B8995C